MTLSQNQLVALAAKRLLLADAAAKSFLGFIQAIYPAFKLASFQHELIETLDALERQTLGKHNLLITMPPRHGKSTIATVAFPAYYMLRQSSRKILSVSYGSELASAFGRQVRDLTLEPIIAQAFPGFQLNPTSTAVDDWRTTDDGRYYACGVGGGTTGRPANLLLIDDPFKSRPEADSPATRNKVHSFYNGSLVNRKEPELDGTPPIEILIQTRWHPDDLAGRIMESDDWSDGDWHHINFPAIKTTVPVTGGLPTESALWPERFPMEMLEKMRRRDPREFAALYQQSPYIQGGNLIRPTWFNYYEKSDLPPRFHTLILAADTSFKAKTYHDPSVIMAVGLSSTGDIYILDVQRERLDYPALKRKFLMENAKWRGKGLRGIYVEDRASGQTILQDLRKEPGISVIPYLPTGGRGTNDKVTRVQSILPLIEGGRVWLPEEAPWLNTFLDEIQSFPNSKHDDQIDALAIALDVLSRIGISTMNSFEFPDISTSLNSLAPLKPMSAKPLTPDLDVPATHQFLFKPLGEL